MIYFINGVRYGVLGVSDIAWTTAAVFSLVTLTLMYMLALWMVKHGSYHRW